MANRRALSLTLCGSLLLLSGCMGTTSESPPQIHFPSTWSAPTPQQAKTTSLQDWWQQFNDPTLSQLIQDAESNSPTLEKAWANILSARATYKGSTADLFPTLDASGKGTRAQENAKTNGSSIGNTLSGALDASWELDLFGKNQHANSAAKARIQARANDWHDARISLAAEVADTYTQYRACSRLAQLYAEEADSQQNTAESMQNAVTAGLSASSNGVLAKASAASATSQAISQNVDCAVLVKSLVALTGKDEPKLMSMLSIGKQTLPQPATFVVEGVPVALLSQRPDLAALERELAATREDISEAKADRYPTITLGGTITRIGTNLSSLLTTWLLSSSIALPLFDGGNREAAVDKAEAAYLVSLAEYKQGIRDSIQDVENALVRLDGANRRAQSVNDAAKYYRSYFNTTDTNWKAGLTSMIDREAARRDAISAEVESISIQRNRIEYWIALYKALGGGWTSKSPVIPPMNQKEKAHG